MTWRHLVERLVRLRPGQVLAQRREVLSQTSKRLREQLLRQLEFKKNRAVALEKHLRLLGPEQVLARGYSITTREEDGKVVRAAEEVKRGERLRTRLKSGEVRSVVGE